MHISRGWWHGDKLRNCAISGCRRWFRIGREKGIFYKLASAINFMRSYN